MKRMSKTLYCVVTFAALSLASQSYAKDPILRVGMSKYCPSKYSGSTTGAEALPAVIAALAANAALQLTSSLIDDITTYLEKKPATTLVDVYPADAFLGFDGTQVRFTDGTQCVWVAAAESFSQPSIDPLGLPIKTVQAPTYNQAELDNIVPFPVSDQGTFTQMTGVSGRVSFYFEAAVATAPTNDAWRLVPQKMYYPSFIAKSNVFQSRTHDVALTIQYSEPGKDDQPFATFSVAETDVEEGSLPAVVLSKRLGWMKPPSVQTTSLKKDSKPFYPIDVKAQLVETRKPDELADAIAKALGAKKTDLSNAVSDKVTSALSQQVRVDTAAKAATDLKTANDAYNTAYTAAKDAYAKWKTATDDTIRTLALNNAHVAYLVLDQATGTAQRAAAAADTSFKAAPDLPPLPKA